MSKIKSFDDAHRTREIAKIKCGAKALALSDDCYCARLKRLTGKDSAKDLNGPERIRVIEDFRALGAYRTRPARVPRTGQAGKARAIWLELHRLGVVRDPSEKALIAFARNRFGIRQDALQWALPSELNALIEALKSWLVRVGGELD